jgi:hypothetical protein
MLPERSMSMRASGDVEVVNSISSPVGGAGACADEIPAKDTMHALIQIKKVKIFMNLIKPPYWYKVVISTGPYPKPTPIVTCALYSVLRPVTLTLNLLSP